MAPYDGPLIGDEPLVLIGIHVAESDLGDGEDTLGRGVLEPGEFVPDVNRG